MIGMNLAQEECNWPSKFQGMDFNIIKILSVPFDKVCPPGPFLVPASLYLILFDVKVTQPVTSLCIITFQKSFIDYIDIMLKYLGLYVKHSLHTCKCSFSYFLLLYATK